jgi:hypothetical protein
MWLAGERRSPPGAGPGTEWGPHQPAFGRPQRARNRGGFSVSAARRYHGDQCGQLGRLWVSGDDLKYWMHCLVGAAHSGMFPCFLGGRLARLLRSIESARMTCRRVCEGSITASM